MIVLSKVFFLSRHQNELAKMHFFACYSTLLWPNDTNILVLPQNGIPYLMVNWDTISFNRLHQRVAKICDLKLCFLNKKIQNGMLTKSQNEGELLFAKVKPWVIHILITMWAFLRFCTKSKPQITSIMSQAFELVT